MQLFSTTLLLIAALAQVSFGALVQISSKTFVDTEILPKDAVNVKKGFFSFKTTWKEQYPHARLLVNGSKPSTLTVKQRKDAVIIQMRVRTDGKWGVVNSAPDQTALLSRKGDKESEMEYSLGVKDGDIIVALLPMRTFTGKKASTKCPLADVSSELAKIDAATGLGFRIYKAINNACGTDTVAVAVAKYQA
jgi:hypothetical protein